MTVLDNIKQLFKLILLFLVSGCLIALIVLMIQVTAKERLLKEAAVHQQSAAMYNELAEKNHLTAMEAKAEAEVFRKDYYKKVFIYGFAYEGGDQQWQ